MSDVLKYSIVDSIPNPSDYKTFTDRYFTRKYILNANEIKNNDIMVLFHSNRITLLTLAPSHFFFKKTEGYKVDFESGKVNRLTNSVSGKGKRGGQQLSPNSVVCKIQFNDGTSFDVPSGIKGTLIEVNQNLLEKPELLKEFPDSNGYIAIILSSIAISEEFKKELMSHDDYVNARKSSK